MNSHWYVGDDSYLTANSFCGDELTGRVESAGSAWSASEIRELLGEDCELDASILEDSWASGVPLNSPRFRRGRKQVRENVEGVTFAALNTVGGFFCSPVQELSSDRPAHGYAACSANSYADAWLPDPVEVFGSRAYDQVPMQDSAAGEQQAYDAGRLRPMTYQRACDVLRVSEASTVTQIRAAYRRMVGEWHPDRLEQSEEKVRAFATKQMATINEAYHLLRELSVASAC
jgi:DnaJ domain